MQDKAPTDPGFPWRYLFKEVSPATRAKKTAQGLCRHHGCRNYARAGRADCDTCKARKRRLKNPQRYAFEQVRESARKRSIGFELTFEEFVQFDQATGYVEAKGRERDSLTIDRIDSSKPYRVDNIRALTWADNCAKKLEGINSPQEAIARALCCVAKGANWRAFMDLAGETLDQVTALQALENRAFEPDEEENDDSCPF